MKTFSAWKDKQLSFIILIFYEVYFVERVFLIVINMDEYNLQFILPWQDGKS